MVMPTSILGFFIFLLSLTLPAICSATQDRTVGAVIFDGISVFGSAQLLPLYADSLGKPVDTKLKTRLGEQTRDYYTSQGYLAPAVSVTDHPDSENILFVHVEEPRVVDIQIAGGTFGQQSAVRERLAPLLERRAVSREDIERFSHTLEQAISIGLESNIIDTSPGRHRVTLTIAPQVRGELTYSAEGSQSLGQHMIAGKVNVISPGAGLREVYMSGLHTIESGGYRSVGAGLSFPTSGRDTVYADISSSRAVPQNYNVSPSRVYRRIWARLKWRHELVETDDLSLALDGSLTLRDYTREKGSETEVVEQLRMDNVRALKYVRHATSTSRIGLAGRVGVDTLGAKRSGTRANNEQDLDFQIIDAHYTLWYGLPAGASFKLDIAGQYSGDNLPYSQRFSVGGSQFARAYESGEFSGDLGIGSKLELRRGFNRDFWMKGARWVPYIYYGIATAHENKSSENSSGAASGIGLRMLTREVSAYIELGKPLTAESEHLSKDARLTGRLTVYF